MKIMELGTWYARGQEPSWLPDHNPRFRRIYQEESLGPFYQAGSLREICSDQLIQFSVDHLFSQYSEVPSTKLSMNCREAHGSRFNH